MVGALRHGRSAPAVEVVRVVDAALQEISTRGWALTGVIGVPVGMQVDVPVSSASGAPPASTRSAPLVKVPVTQGGVDVPVRAHPVIAHTPAIVTAGWPDNITRG